MINVQEISLDPDTRRAWRAGDEIALSRKEFEIGRAHV